MTGRGLLVAAMVTIALLITACSVDPTASGRSATPTLNPNQLEMLRRSAGVSPTPRPVVTAAPSGTSVPGSPTPTPGTTPAPSPYDASLEAMLPTTIHGLPLTRYSAPASMFSSGGDMCSVLCPAEPERLAGLSGVAVDDITIAFAYPDPNTGPRVAILAIRFPGLATDKLVDIRIREGGAVGSTSDLPADRRDLDVGSRHVTHALYPPFYQNGQGEYLLATDDVLFVVFGDPPSAAGEVPADVRLAVEALP